MKLFGKKLREALAKIAANPAELLKLAPAACQSAVKLDEGLVLRESGEVISKSRRDELLAKCLAGDHVELEVTVLAYEQKTGESNRNFVRFRDGAMMSLGRSGKGNPVLRDHAQYNTLAKGGSVTASSTEKRDENDYAVRQTWKLSAPWAVEMALRGLLDTVSIGWRPTGPVLCSACNVAVFTRCYHFPGDRLVEQEDGAGKRKVRAADGPITVEWIYTEAELVETSVVNIPGVPSARIGDVRASLSATLRADDDSLRDEREGDDFLNGDEFPEEKLDMDPKLLALLGLSATATLSEVLAAIDAREKSGKADKAELEILRTEHALAKKDLEAHEAAKKKTEEDGFIADALSTGRIAKGDETAWREFFQLSPERATKRMSERAVGASTPVGLPRQSEKAPVTPVGAPITGGLSSSKGFAKVLAALAATARAPAFAQAFGYVDPSGVDHQLGATSIVNAGEIEAAKVGFHAAFLQSLEQKTDDPIQGLYTTVNSNKKIEEWNWMGDLPGFEEWIGDRKLAGLEAFKLRVENKKWSNGIRVKNDDFKDDALGLLPPQITGLSDKARRHRWDLMIKLLLNGFDGDDYPEVGTGLAYDGAFFFSTTHRGGTPGGNTLSNKLTLALDAAGLTAAELLLRSMTTLDGQDPLDTHGTHLIVGPKLEYTATKLLTQEFLANGESNPHRGKYKLIVSNRIRGAQDDDWFLADLSQSIKPCLFQMREEISTSAVMGAQGSQNDSVPRFSSDEVWFGAEARYNVGYFEFRLIVGSRP